MLYIVRICAFAGSSIVPLRMTTISIEATNGVTQMNGQVDGQDEEKSVQSCTGLKTNKSEVGSLFVLQCMCYKFICREKNIL